MVEQAAAQATWEAEAGRKFRVCLHHKIGSACQSNVMRASHSNMGWGYTPVEHAQGPGLNPQYHQSKPKKNRALNKTVNRVSEYTHEPSTRLTLEQ